MKQKIARALPALVAAFALTLIPGINRQAGAQTPTLLRISNQLPATAAVTKGLELWKSKVEAATGGRFKVEVYSNSQLYKDNEVFPAVQGGQIDMGLIVSAQFTVRDRLYWDIFMHMMTISWRAQALLADLAFFVLGLTLGHAVMRIVSGPAKSDGLARR